MNSNSLDDIIERWRQREADPVWQRRQAAQAEWKALEAANLLEWQASAVGAAKLRLLRSLRLPARALDLVLNGTLDSTAATRALEVPAPIIVLGGASRSGKTVAAVSVIQRRVYDDRHWFCEGYAPPRFIGGTVLFVTAAAITRWDRFDDRAMNRLLKSPCLVIDDMGVEALDGKGFALSLFDELIDARYGGPEETVITTNLSITTFAKRYGPRIAARLRECGRFEGVGDDKANVPRLGSPK